MSKQEKPTTAFVLSLIAGIFILINGIALGVLSSFIGKLIPTMIPIPIPGMPGYTQDIPVGSIISAALLGLTVIGVIFGVLVLLGAIMMYHNPTHKTGWGIIILLFSIFSIIIGGGFVIGFILGIIGGALTLAWKPKNTTPQSPPAQPVASTSTTPT